MNFPRVQAVVGAKRTLDVLQVLSDGDQYRFSEIESEIDISSDTLNRSLERLVEYRLVERKQIHERNVQYRVTDFGLRLLAVAERLESKLEQSESGE